MDKHTPAVRCLRPGPARPRRLGSAGRGIYNARFCGRRSGISGRARSAERNPGRPFHGQLGRPTGRHRLPAEIAREFQHSTIYRPVPDDFLERVVAESLKLPAHVWRAALAGCLAVNYTAQLGDIQAPTLIFQGEQDTVFSRAAQDALVSGIARAVLKVYPETGHAIHWERPDQVVDDMKKFIDTQGDDISRVPHVG